MKVDKYSIAKLILLQERTFTYQKLADTLHLSSKTIRNQIDDVEEFLNKYDIELYRQPGIGIELVGQRQDILNCYKQCLVEIKDSHELSSTIRKNIIVFNLLTKSKKITMSYLEDLLFITRPSIYNDLKEIEEFFETNDVKIEKTRKTGIELICGEKRKRKCLLDWATSMLKEDKVNYYSYPEIINYMDYVFGDFNNHYRTYLRNFILSVENFAKFKITHSELERIITLFLISFERIQKGYTITINHELKKKLKNVKILEFMKENDAKLNSKFGIQLNDNEILYLSSLLSSNSTSTYEVAFQESSNPKLLFEIIDIFYNTLQDYMIEFDKDYFRVKLFPYLEKVMQKSNFEYDLYNPNEETIKVLYPKLFNLAKLINPIMNEIVNKELPSSGIATITLLLADISLIQINKLVCYYVVTNNIFEQDLNIHTLKNNIPNLEVVTDETIINFSASDIDFIISNEPIDTVKIPVFIAPLVFTPEFLILLKQNVKEIIEKKANSFFKK
ncbi:BglG family transcription antiterminator [Anaerorhabdus sp.]|uniref:Transcriptional regulator ManR n=2 Tax=root TaxID=1 RepID=A0A645B5C6_9ZZZZ|nr:PRD domain-containing protein [Anaerorhabdus sp.]MEA4875840.1 PRD domain-containing protein [Anaerorhabdus sp.]